MTTLFNFSSVIALSICPSLSWSVNAPFSLKHSVLPCTLAKPSIIDRGNSAVSPGRRSTIVFARFHGAERFIDEADVDECAFAALVLRSGYTKTSKGSRQDSYWCDLESIKQNLKVAEKDDYLNLFYLNHAVKAFPFFPEELPSGLISEPPAYALDVNYKLLSKYVPYILPHIITSKVGVRPASLETYRFDYLLLQCLSTAIFAGIDMAEKAFLGNPNELMDAVFTKDHDCMFDLISSPIREKCLRQRLKFLEKKLVRLVRGVKVERLPKHYVLTEFYLSFVLKEQKNLGVAHLQNKLKF